MSNSQVITAENTYKEIGDYFMDKASQKRPRINRLARLGIICVAIASCFFLCIANNSSLIGKHVWFYLTSTVGIRHVPANCDVKSYGATGNGLVKDTISIQNAINACGEGGIVTFPSGKYLTAPLFLYKNNITLNIADGAIILGSEIPSDYRVKSGQKVATPTLALINSYHVSGITITGGGIIDGQGASWWASGKSTHDRPRLIELAYGRNITISHVRLENAAVMHLYLKNTSNVTIDGVTIHAPSNAPNTDGIDANGSNNLLIENSTISTGGDNIGIKSGPTPVPSYNITVNHCQFGNGSGVALGSDLEGGVHDVLVENSTFEGTTIGLRMKATRATGGKVTAITYTNLRMTNVKYPLWFAGYYPEVPSFDASQPITATTPNYSNITVTNLTATGAISAGKIVGVPEEPLAAITLNGVKITAEEGLVVRNAAVSSTEGITITVSHRSAYIIQVDGSVVPTCVARNNVPTLNGEAEVPMCEVYQ